MESIFSSGASGRQILLLILYYSIKYHLRIVILINNTWRVVWDMCVMFGIKPENRKTHGHGLITGLLQWTQTWCRFTHTPVHSIGHLLHFIFKTENDKHWPSATGSNTSWPLEGNKGSDKRLDGCMDEQSVFFFLLLFIMISSGLFIGVKMSGARTWVRLTNLLSFVILWFLSPNDMHIKWNTPRHPERISVVRCRTRNTYEHTQTHCGVDASTVQNDATFTLASSSLNIKKNY